MNCSRIKIVESNLQNNGNWVELHELFLLYLKYSNTANGIHGSS